MKYKVTIGYYDFLFADAEQAMSFAQMARMSYVSDRANDNIEVSIELINEKED